MCDQKDVPEWAKLSPKPGDILVWTPPEGKTISRDAVAQLLQCIKASCGPDIVVLALQPGSSFYAMNAETRETLHKALHLQEGGAK